MVAPDSSVAVADSRLAVVGSVVDRSVEAVDMSAVDRNRTVAAEKVADNFVGSAVVERFAAAAVEVAVGNWAAVAAAAGLAVDNWVAAAEGIVYSYLVILLAHWLFCATPVAVAAVAVLVDSGDSSAVADMFVVGTPVGSPGNSAVPDNWAGKMSTFGFGSLAAAGKVADNFEREVVVDNLFVEDSLVAEHNSVVAAAVVADNFVVVGSYP